MTCSTIPPDIAGPPMPGPPLGPPGPPGEAAATVEARSSAAASASGRRREVLRHVGSFRLVGNRPARRRRTAGLDRFENAECAQGFPLGDRGCNRALRTAACRYNRLQRTSSRPRSGGVQSGDGREQPRPYIRPPMNPKAPNGIARILVVDDDVRLRDLLTRYLAEQGFQVAALARRARPRQEAAARPAAPRRARPDAARRGRARRLPAPARRRRDRADHHADREGRGRRPHRRPRDGRRRLPAKPFNPRELVARIHAVLRRHARAARARRAGRRGQRRVRPPSRSTSPRARSRATARHDPPHDRRVLAAQGVRAASAPAARARKADAARARPRPRGVRPRDRRAGVAAAQADRARSRQSALHPDGVGLRLRLRARRPPDDARSPPRRRRSP